MHWILQKFEEACAAYAKRPAESSFHEDASAIWRSSITARLHADGFTGVYPHFRRRGKGCEFISFSECVKLYPNQLTIRLVAATAIFDNNNSNTLGGISFDDATAYDCQIEGNNKERFV